MLQFFHLGDSGTISWYGESFNKSIIARAGIGQCVCVVINLNKGVELAIN